MNPFTHPRPWMVDSYSIRSMQVPFPPPPRNDLPCLQLMSIRLSARLVCPHPYPSSRLLAYQEWGEKLKEEEGAWIVDGVFLSLRVPHRFALGTSCKAKQ